MPQTLNHGIPLAALITLVVAALRGVVLFCIAKWDKVELFGRFLSHFAQFGQPNMPVDDTFIAGEPLTSAAGYDYLIVSSSSTSIAVIIALLTAPSDHAAAHHH